MPLRLTFIAASIFCLRLIAVFGIAEGASTEDVRDKQSRSALLGNSLDNAGDDVTDGALAVPEQILGFEDGVPQETTNASLFHPKLDGGVAQEGSALTEGECLNATDAIDTAAVVSQSTSPKIKVTVTIEDAEESSLEDGIVTAALYVAAGPEGERNHTASGEFTVTIPEDQSDFLLNWLVRPSEYTVSNWPSGEFAADDMNQTKTKMTTEAIKFMHLLSTKDDAWKKYLYLHQFPSWGDYAAGYLSEGDCTEQLTELQTCASPALGDKILVGYRKGDPNVAFEAGIKCSDGKQVIVVFTFKMMSYEEALHYHLGQLTSRTKRE